MKKKLAFLFLSTSMTITAQIPDSGYASDFNVTAYQPWLSNAGFNSDGTFSLYEYLDNGYTVFIEFSATWCGPCWWQHIYPGYLDSLYMLHGPFGFPGVSPTTTNDVMIFWMEGDPLTPNSELVGSQNWIEPIPGRQIQYPMFNPDSATTAAIIDDFNILGFSYQSMVCPDRYVTDQIALGYGTDSIYSGIFQCNPYLSFIENKFSDFSIEAFPNPTSENITIESKNIAKKEIQIFDATGRTIDCPLLINNDDNVIISTVDLSSGIYTIRVIGEKNLSVRIMVQN